MVLRRQPIQLVAAALIVGTCLGAFASPWWGIMAVGVLVVGVMVRRRSVTLVVATALGVGLLRGWSAIPSAVTTSGLEETIVLRGLGSARGWFEAASRRTLPTDEAELLNGLLLGSRSALPSDVRAQFRKTGTSHIIAVSGYNVSIVVAVIVALLSGVALPPALRTTLIFVAIASFVVMTGASASVVRAGVMGSLTVLARTTGRLSNALHALLISVGAMIVVTPRVASDIGFHLSVAATFGLLTLSGPIQNRLRFVPETLGIRSSLASTLAAIAVTQPVILLVFGQISLIAPAVNLVVLAFVPLAMLVGFSVGVVAGVMPPLAPVVAWAAWLPLSFMLAVVRIGAAVPWASVTISRLTSVIIAAAWSAVVALALSRYFRSRALA